jgi:hypothetical protein
MRSRQGGEMHVRDQQKQSRLYSQRRPRQLSNVVATMRQLNGSALDGGTEQNATVRAAFPVRTRSGESACH